MVAKEGEGGEDWDSGGDEAGEGEEGVFEDEGFDLYMIRLVKQCIYECIKLRRRPPVHIQCLDFDCRDRLLRRPRWTGRTKSGLTSIPYEFIDEAHCIHHSQ